jgi:TonB family protein
MPQAPVLDGVEADNLESVTPELRLLIDRESGSQVFLQNLKDLFRPRESPPLQLQSAPAPFWPDVFVDLKLPWRPFFESGGYHIVALLLILAGSRFLLSQPQVTSQPAFNHSDVVYFSPSEYLPPLDTRSPTPARAQKADPELSAQAIISVPPEATNHSQTIVSAPQVQLKKDIALPNTVAWSDTPRMPIAPAPLVPASEISRLAPRMEHSVIAPPPVFQDAVKDDAPSKSMLSPQPSVIAPPPSLDTASKRRVGDMNIGHSTVIAPAPQLALDAQRTPQRSSSLASLHGHPQVIAPPPSVGASGGSRSGGSMIALSLHPAVGAPPQPAPGNRRGSFAATPQGHAGASGTPGNPGGGTSAQNGNGSKSAGKLPSGLYVGKTSNPTSAVAGDAGSKSPSNTVNPNLLAAVRSPRISRTEPESDVKLSEPERAVFAGRKVYSLSLNMPNLNSSGGSWIIRFAAMKPDTNSADSSSAEAPSNLSSPVATSKVDPAYPLELMKQNVSGTVILYAVIHADGTVGGVRVLRSVDERLDRFAGEAIAKWRFQPAQKDGTAVDVEATFWIPFHPSKTISNF